MAETRERAITAPADVRRQIEEFISSNEHSRDLQLRWLASVLRSTVSVLSAVEDNRLSADLSHRVREFRLSEIAAERAKREDEIQRLEDEARKLHGAAKVA